MDETYIRVKGKWVYLYRAVDSAGATIDFLLSAKRDAAAAERFSRQSLARREPSGAARNQHRSCGSKPRVLWRRIAGIDRCSTSIMFWNRITGPSNAGCAQANIFVHSGEPGVRRAGDEAVQMIRKGQACWSATGAKVGLLHRFILGLFAAKS